MGSQGGHQRASGGIGATCSRAATSPAQTSRFVAVNDLIDPETTPNLPQYDSVLGRFQGRSRYGGGISGDGNRDQGAEREDRGSSLGRLGRGGVIESTGLFTKREGAQKQLDAGARR